MLVFSSNCAALDSVHKLLIAELEHDIFSKAQSAIVRSQRAVCDTDFSLSPQMFGNGLLIQQLEGVALSTINSTMG